MKKEKKQKTPTYNLTLKQIETIKEQATHEATVRAVRLVVAIPSMVLHDKFGFGNKRLSKFTECLADELDSFEKGYFTIEDADKYIEEHCNVKFK